MSTELTGKLVSCFNVRLNEKQSRKRALEPELSRLDLEYKETKDKIASYVAAEEKWFDEKTYCAEVYTKGRYKNYEEKEAIWKRYEHAEAALNLARVGKKTVEEKLRHIGDSLIPVKKEYNALSKELDNLLNLPEEKKAEAYYSWLLEDMQTAKSEGDYVALAEKFSDISGYKNCAELADRCDKCIEELREAKREADYRKLLDDMQEAKSEEDYVALAKKFRAVNGYKNCAELADKCEIRIEELREAYYNRLLEEMQEAKSEKDYAALAKKFSDISGYKDCAELADSCKIRIEELKQEAYYNRLLEEMQAAEFEKDYAKSEKDYAALAKKFSDISGYKDCAELADKCNICIEELIPKMETQIPLMTVKFENLKSKYLWSKNILGLLTMVLTAFAMYKVHFLLATGLLVWLVFAIVKGLVENNPPCKEISTGDSITVRYNNLRDGITVLQNTIKKFYQWFAPLFAVSALLLWILL